MKSSRSNSHAHDHAPLAGGSGVDTHAITAPADPIAAWLDLMEVVDALRPERSSREAHGDIAARKDYVYRL